MSPCGNASYAQCRSVHNFTWVHLNEKRAEGSPNHKVGEWVLVYIYRVITNKCSKVWAISGGLFYVHKCIGHTMEETSAGHFIQNRFHHPVTFLSLTAGAWSIRLPPRHTAQPSAVCAGRHSHCLESRDLFSERIYPGHSLWPTCAKCVAECPPQLRKIL